MVGKMPAVNDPKIVQQEYATDEVLRIRQQTHAEYTVPKIDFVDWVLSNVKWRGNERVLDLGCGNGIYYTPLMEGNFSHAPESVNFEYHGADISPGTLENHPLFGSGALTVADAMDLPYADNSFDVVMANHMLYHVQDIDATVLEIKRVLKPGGVLVSATNSQLTMPEIQVLLKRAIVILTRMGSANVEAPLPASDLFALENGCSQLSHHFYAVMRSDLPGTLVFHEVDPLMRYIQSTRLIREPQLPDDVHWDDVMMIVRQNLDVLLNHLGEIPINKLNGLLIGTDNGDFVQEFLDHQSKANST